MSAMNSFMDSCRTAEEYPYNLVSHHTYRHRLKGYHDRLDKQESNLFCDEGNGALDIWEIEDEARGADVLPTRACNSEEMEVRLCAAFSPVRRDPRCRFIFVHAPHSRDKLKTSRKMFTLVLTYHQVMPTFLDILFPFGKQLYPQDFHFSGFWHESRLSELQRGPRIPELGRSGRDFQLCYSLKSVEAWTRDPDWPWSVRQMAVYHSFDTGSSAAVWIIVKGNQLIRDRLATEMKSPGVLGSSGFATSSEAFASALKIHLLFCDWAGENWRWYVKFLEEKFQESTRPTLLAVVDRPPNLELKGNQPFSLGDLQKIQSIGGKVNEAFLTIESNANVLRELKQHYLSLRNLEGFPERIAKDCGMNIDQFESRIVSVENDLWVQRLRLKALLRLLADRNRLLCGILEYQHMATSQLCANRVEVMTQDMHRIAQKTKQETISMRVITLVTLFFLPGTFISTFMSTDIIKYTPTDARKSQRVIQPAALRLFLAITLPLMIATFVVWYGFYLWVDREERMKPKGGEMNSES